MKLFYRSELYLFLKSRLKSIELQILNSLNNRMILSEKEKLHFQNLKKGYIGELSFDSLTKQLLTNNCIILNGLTLKLNNSTFQIDSLFIMSDTIFLFEIKNYEGDYYFSNNDFYTNSNIKILNPLNQLSRAETLLLRLLQDFGFSIPINAKVIFVNPEFTLYEAPRDLPIIFPTQINHLFKKLNNKHSKIVEKHQFIADKLLSLHIEDAQYTNLPTFKYEQLRKGITCYSCDSFLISVEGHKCICMKCGHAETVSSAVMRSVNEFKLLFPEEKITSSRILEWCQVIESKKRIQRVLDKNFKKVGNYRWTFFE